MRKFVTVSKSQPWRAYNVTLLLAHNTVPLSKLPRGFADFRILTDQVRPANHRRLPYGRR